MKRPKGCTKFVNMVENAEIKNRTRKRIEDGTSACKQKSVVLNVLLIASDRQTTFLISCQLDGLHRTVSSMNHHHTKEANQFPLTIEVDNNSGQKENAKNSRSNTIVIGSSFSIANLGCSPVECV